MAKCIPYVYGKANREILDIIETERDKNMNGNFLPEFWQVGAAICTKSVFHYTGKIKEVLTWIKRYTQQH